MKTERLQFGPIYLFFLATWKCLFFKMCNWIVLYGYIGTSIAQFITRARSSRGRCIFSSSFFFFHDEAFRCHPHGARIASRRYFSNMATCSRGKFCIQIAMEVEASKACLRWRVLIQLPRKRCRLGCDSAQKRWERTLKNFNWNYLINTGPPW